MRSILRHGSSDLLYFVMKRLFTMSIALPLLAAISFGQDTADSLLLRQLSENGASAFRSRSFAAAVAYAKKALALTVKIYGEKNVETVQAYANLGAALRENRELGDAEEAYQTAVNILTKLPNLKGTELIVTYGSLANVQNLRERESDAEASYLAAIAAAETRFGKGSKESFAQSLNLANLYATWRRFGRADEYYLKSYIIGYKNFKQDSLEVHSITAHRACFVEFESGYYDSKEFHKRFKEIMQLKDSLYANPKAISLPKPAWPKTRTRIRTSGVVAIRVIIDPDGSVRNAKMMCGSPLFEIVAVEAALKAKFEARKKDGNRIPSGVITYRFVP